LSAIAELLLAPLSTHLHCQSVVQMRNPLNFLLLVTQSKIKHFL